MRTAVPVLLAVAAAACAVAGLSSCAKPSPPPTSPPPPATHAAKQAPPSTPVAGAKSVLMVIAQKGFRDEELLTPKKAFEGAGYAVTVVAPTTGSATGTSGASVIPDGTIAAADPGEFDAVIFVGGPGASALFEDADAHRLAREAVDGGKVVGAICLAPSILARAGLLKGKRATVWESESKALESGGATYTGESVTVDGKLVTGNAPEAAARFADELLKLLK